MRIDLFNYVSNHNSLKRKKTQRTTKHVLNNSIKLIYLLLVRISKRSPQDAQMPKKTDQSQSQTSLRRPKQPIYMN
ncbi:unnamed protein product [Schistosoma rodhaini]|uniref:Uncharacterized protein n=1 Tax=Schistosoma rodhaini TaxID=6188 RepID=A0AA85EXU1_9TREM|nr:unnamed protein product [Schistosoma rodhaini]